MGERFGASEPLRPSALHQSSFRNLRLQFNHRSQMSQLTVTHPKLESAANAHAGAPVAARAVDRPHTRAAMVAIAVAAMNAHCAARTDASRPVGTGRAGGGVGFADLNREQTQYQQAGTDCLNHQRVPSTSILCLSAHRRASLTPFHDALDQLFSCISGDERPVNAWRAQGGIGQAISRSHKYYRRKQLPITGELRSLA